MRPLAADDPRRIGAYRLLGRLGRGAMGAVYLGRSPGGRPVAVKVVRGELAEDPTFRERFRREVASARAVGGFWTAVVVDADTEAERPWLATEYVAGPNLHEAVTRHGPLPEPAVRMLTAGLAEALSAIHAAGLVHRDLKPGNVLLGVDGPRVIDFGISRAMEGASLTMTGVFFGTPGFFSPEQTTGEEIGPASDVFSLAAVLVFAATGSSPFGEGHTTALLYRVVHTDPDLSRLSPGLRELLGPCLAKDPVARPTPAQLLAAVGDVGTAAREPTQWLPEQVTSLIAERTELLWAEPAMPAGTRVATAAAPAPADPQPPAAQAPRPPAERPLPPPPAQKPPTRLLTKVAEEPTPPAAPAPPPLPVAAAQAVGKAVGRARAKATARTAARNAAATAARRLDQALAEGTRFSGTRGGSVFFGVLGLVLAVTFAVAVRNGALSTGTPYGDVFEVLVVIGATYFALSGVVSLMRASSSPVELVLSPLGLTVLRGRRRRHLDWHQVTGLRIVGRGRKRWLVAWLADGVPPPGPLGSHRFPEYRGGICLYPLGQKRNRREVRRQARELHEALRWYARGSYDGSGSKL
ncbi:hypothetical protein GCM10012275_21440 [Longimycelium tulufanense]|uniref:Protein kinase domain-containing protein n=1 Tax=Longimycelium tulufanense TaxID=907463 RepID=A0A8J3FTK2_9PSEU|nr:serine/threonine-protein kinase [Longimycelium tulufanense]GGM50292.1 hypothetical protein GCM10012275_21440 [Longimycelium tulufanense]